MVQVSDHVRAFQMDGREFIRRMGGAEAQHSSESLSGMVHRIVHEALQRTHLHFSCCNLS